MLVLCLHLAIIWLLKSGAQERSKIRWLQCSKRHLRGKKQDENRQCLSFSISISKYKHTSNKLCALFSIFSIEIACKLLNNFCIALALALKWDRMFLAYSLFVQRLFHLFLLFTSWAKKNSSHISCALFIWHEWVAWTKRPDRLKVPLFFFLILLFLLLSSPPLPEKDELPKAVNRNFQEQTKTCSCKSE